MQNLTRATPGCTTRTCSRWFATDFVPSTVERAFSLNGRGLVFFLDLRFRAEQHDGLGVFFAPLAQRDERRFLDEGYDFAFSRS